MPDDINTDFTGSGMLQRPPARREFRSTTDPLIVTPTLVSRVDDTPRSVRPQDEGSAVGRDGKEVDNPDAHPEPQST
jgi:hypothetical protein